MQWFLSVGDPDDPLDDQLHVSVLTIGELDRGVIRLAPGRRRDHLRDSLELLIADYGRRILPIDLAVARAWSSVAETNRRSGLIVGAVDELIAATAIAHDLVLVSRNVGHFSKSGCKLLCPWSA
jgi:predicted nucleic acid-binding protein